MSKQAELSETDKCETNGREGDLTEIRQMPPYRIICNSEHFIVLNPVRRSKPKETNGIVKSRVDIN